MEDLEPTEHGASLEASIERASHWSSIGRHDLAREELGRALVRWPNVADLHVFLARSYNDEDQHEAALDEAHTALSIDPESVFALSTLSRVLMDMGRHQESEKHLLTALSLEPNEPHLYFIYSLLLFKTGHMDKAEATLRKSLQLDPQEPASHSLLAQILAEKTKSASEANPHAAYGLELEPDSDFSHLAAGQTHLRGGRPFQARRHFREALRIDPTDEDIEELWLYADKCCRWVYLPYYYWSLLLDRIPGGPFAIWILFVLFLTTSESLGIPRGIKNLIAISYMFFVIYTWVAELLANAWIKVVSPK